MPRVIRVSTKTWDNPEINYIHFIYIIDWVNTHQINSDSQYFNGHLDPENHKNVMNCTYYIVFEQNYKNVQWWNVKKERIKKQIAENNKKQMEVKIF